MAAQTLNFLGGKFQGLDSNGDPLASGKVHFYEPGTTTRKDTYNASDLAVANANPVILDGNGRADIWLNGNYKVVLTDASDVTIYTVDALNPDTDDPVLDILNIDNGSFETNTAGDSKTPDSWDLTEYTGATTALDTADQRHGGKAFRSTSVGSGGANVISSNFIECTPLRNYVFSWLMKSSVVDVRNLVEVVWYDKDQLLLSTTPLYDESAANPTAWEKQEVEVTPVANARFFKLRMYACHPSDGTAGSTWYDDVRVTTQPITVEVPAVAGTLAPYKNLRIVRDSAVQITITVDEIVLTASDNTQRKLTSINETSDMSVPLSAGTGGLESGSTEQANTWYEVWLGYNTTTVSVIAALVESGNTVTWPAGYDYVGQVGAVFNDGSQDIRDFIQVDNIAGIVDEIALANGVQTSFTVVPLANFVPPQARMAHGWVTHDSSSAANSTLVKLASTSDGKFEKQVRVSSFNGGTQSTFHDEGFEIAMLNEQEMYYRVSGAGSPDADIYISGWEL